MKRAFVLSRFKGPHRHQTSELIEAEMADRFFKKATPKQMDKAAVRLKTFGEASGGGDTGKRLQSTLAEMKLPTGGSL
jgi:hypothetical protein